MKSSMVRYKSVRVALGSWDRGWLDMDCSNGDGFGGNLTRG
jgi:hypothetical protein